MAPHIPHPKVILITGCSSGFGLLTAARLSSRGHHVYATMRNLEKQKALLDEVKRRRGRISILPLDVTDESSIDKAIEIVDSECGCIDVLVNNAGYGVGGFFEDLTQEDIRAQMETNFFGVQNVTRRVIPFMRRQGKGTIINISSIAGLYALPAFGAYNASKWALEGFTESLSYELKLFGINVCMIEPGTFNTTIFHANKRYAKNFDNPQSPYYKLSQSLNKRVMDYVAAVKKEPENIARLVEKLIQMKSPPLRSFPDIESRLIYSFKRFLPFAVFSGVIRSGFLKR